MKTDKVEMREKTNDNKKIIYCDFSDFEKDRVSLSESFLKSL